MAQHAAESDIVLPIQLPAGVPSNTRNAIAMSVSAIGTQRNPCVLAQVGETRSRNVARLRARSKSIWVANACEILELRPHGPANRYRASIPARYPDPYERDQSEGAERPMAQAAAELYRQGLQQENCRRPRGLNVCGNRSHHSLMTRPLASCVSVSLTVFLT